MKIIHILTRLDKGGSAEDTIVLVDGQTNKSHDVVLVKGFSKESAMAENESQEVLAAVRTAEEKGVRVIDLPPLVRRVSPINDLKAFWGLFSIFWKERPDIVHTHTSKAGILGRWAALLARVPVRIHTPHGHVFHSYFPPIITRIIIMVERITACVTDMIIAVSDQEMKETLAQHVGTAEKFVTIYSAVDLKRYMRLTTDVAVMRRKLGIPEGFHVVGTVGRLVPIKGHRYLLEAARLVIDEIPNTIFVLVGDGELRKNLEELARSLKIIDNVVFTGWRSDIAQLLSTFDLFTLPSLNEGMGKVLVEAMASSKPIVASKVGGVEDLVTNGVTGILVPPAEPKLFAKGILKLLKNSSLADELAQNGREKVYPAFDIATRLDKIEMLYREMAVKKKLPL